MNGNKRGDKRDDGLMFWSKCQWVTPEKFEELRLKKNASARAGKGESRRAYFNEYNKRNAESVRKMKMESKARIRASMTDEQKEIVRAADRARIAADRDAHNAKARYRRFLRREEINERARTLRERDPEKYAALLKRRRERKSHIVRLAESSRTRMRLALGKNKHYRSCFYVGCSWPDLAAHLEVKWKPGMSWDNYALDGWHIDHITPLASAKSPEELIPLLHYTNLQPLWALENIAKGAKMPLIE